MATNDFLPFAGAAGANVITQAVYAALAAQQTGFQSGVANSAQLNKVWRQSSIMSAVLAQFISDRTGQNATDDGTTATLLANLKLSAAALNGDQTQNFNVAAATQSQHAVQIGQFLGLLAGSGYFKIPVMVAGVLRTVLMQWGAYTSAASGTTAALNFPIAFPNACFGVWPSASNSSVAAGMSAAILSASQFTITSAYSTTQNTFVFAIGW